MAFKFTEPDPAPSPTDVIGSDGAASDVHERNREQIMGHWAGTALAERITKAVLCCAQQSQ